MIIKGWNMANGLACMIILISIINKLLVAIVKF